jgi:hypothetical protein
MNRKVHNICVYCGSSGDVSPVYRETAARLGAMIASRGHTLVYGGAAAGTMGIIADAVLRGGGRVTGIIPSDIPGEAAHPGLTELHLVDSMHTRKRMMIEKSDVLVAMPGGFGTLDEMMEAFAWRQLGLHPHPCIFLNTAGFYNHLLRFLEHCVNEGFLRPPHYELVRVADTPEELLELLELLDEL